MKKIKKYRGVALVILGLIVMAVETIYFGMNSTAQSPAELIWDVVYSILISIGICLTGYDWIDYFWSKLSEITISDTEQTSI